MHVCRVLHQDSASLAGTPQILPSVIFPDDRHLVALTEVFQDSKPSEWVGKNRESWRFSFPLLFCTVVLNSSWFLSSLGKEILFNLSFLSIKGSGDVWLNSKNVKHVNKSDGGLLAVKGTIWKEARRPSNAEVSPTSFGTLNKIMVILLSQITTCKTATQPKKNTVK